MAAAKSTRPATRADLEALPPGVKGEILKGVLYTQPRPRARWYVDLEARTLTVSRLEGGRWSELGVYGNDDKVRAAPFEAVEIDLAEWWGS